MKPLPVFTFKKDTLTPKDGNTSIWSKLEARPQSASNQVVIQNQLNNPEESKDGALPSTSTKKKKSKKKRKATGEQ